MHSENSVPNCSMFIFLSEFKLRSFLINSALTLVPFLFSKDAVSPCVPTNLLSNGYQDIFPRLKRQVRETDHPHSSGIQLRMRGATPLCPHGAQSNNFTFTFTLKPYNLSLSTKGPEGVKLHV